MQPIKIFVISGGTGASGKLLAQTVLAQFKTADVDLRIFPQVQHVGQLDAILSEARPVDSVVVHTLVDAHLHDALADRLNEQHIASIDLVGQLLSKLTQMLRQDPLGQPGRLRELNPQYYKRIAAVEFAVDHDDGARVHELPLAEIVLTGVSRVGKTPMSMYLSTLGWKVANIPLAPSITPPRELFEIDPRRVFGLTLEPGQLIYHRRLRQRHMGIPGQTAYMDPEAVYEELEFARKLFRRGMFTVIDMTDKPVEEVSDQIIRRLGRQLQNDLH
jgi:[pyruvate, water dikinase]-phosphate phosphotransferase / [pyruvate, water dikinase] kinase